MAGKTWSHVKLSEIIDVKHGFAFPGEYIREDPPGDILLTPGNFAVGGGFKADKFKYFDGQVPEEYVLHESDLIVTMTDLSKRADTLGYPALVPKPQQFRFLHNQRLGKVLIRDEAKVDKRFISYLLRTPDYRHEVLASATGTTVKHTSPSRILAFNTSIPPLPEQRAIAHILGTLDDKIELNRRMSQTFEQIARAIFKSWFVDFDPVRAKAEGRQPPGLDPETAALFPDSFTDSPLGPVPSGWSISSVGNEFNLTMGQSPPGDTYNETCDGTPFFQGRADFGFRFPSRRVYCTAPTRFAEPGDTLVSVRAPVGDINMAAEHCCVGRGIAALRHKTKSGSYTYYAMHRLAEAFDRFDAEGTVFGSIGKTDFRDLQVLAPRPPILGRFDRLASPLDAAIASNERESATLAAIRDALLPRLLSGEIHVGA